MDNGYGSSYTKNHFQKRYYSLVVTSLPHLEYQGRSTDPKGKSCAARRMTLVHALKDSIEANIQKQRN